jgi:glutaredoxin
MPATQKYAFKIYGWDGCGYFMRAQAILKQFKAKHSGCTVEVKSVPRTFWTTVVATYAPKGHTTSPLVFCNSKYIGGHDNLVAWVGKAK